VSTYIFCDLINTTGMSHLKVNIIVPKMPTAHDGVYVF